MSKSDTPAKVGSSEGLGLDPERAALAAFLSACADGGLDGAAMQDAMRELVRPEGQRLRAALLRCIENVERWLRTDEAASPEESRSIYEQMCAAVGRKPIDVEALDDGARHQRASSSGPVVRPNVEVTG